MKLNSDRIVSYTAIFISLLTLVVFIYQTNLMREQSRLSVMPRLDFHTNLNENDSLVAITLTLENKGLGPAIIDSVYVVSNGRARVEHFDNYFEQWVQDFNKTVLYKSTRQVSSGSALNAGENLKLFSFGIPKQNFQKFETFYSNKKQFQLEVLYRSIYGDQWKIALSSEDANPVKI